MDQVDSSIAFSPDGRHFAFVRDDLKKSETAIIVATSDGKDERRLAVRKAPDRFESDFATRIGWAADGNTLACAASSTDAQGYYATVVGVSTIDGSQKSLTKDRWAFTGQVVWLKDGQGLITVASEQGQVRASAQLWHLSYPGGEARRITNDLNRYIDVSLTADSRSLVTIQSNRISDIWVAPSKDLSQAKQITTGAVEGFGGVNWTPDGRIVYLSRVSGKSDVWIMNADGSGQKQLTYEGQNVRPIVTPDGRFILFSSNREGRTNVWRMDLDGNNARQLTNGGTNGNAYPAPDSRSFVYISQDAGNGTLWTMSLDGGQATQLSNPTVNLPVVSPDGKQIACFYWDEQANPPRGVMVMPFEGGPVSKRFRIESTSESFVLYWTPDSRTILYVSNLSNIWGQPIDGGPPVQVTDLQGDQLFNFHYSLDGKKLALVRGRVINDVILISNSEN
jgi:TolB protein